MVVENVDGTELKFKNPGRLLLVVIGFLFWAVGFIDPEPRLVSPPYPGWAWNRSMDYLRMG